jgi:hypothetical protein
MKMSCGEESKVYLEIWIKEEERGMGCNIDIFSNVPLFVRKEP